MKYFMLFIFWLALACPLNAQTDHVYLSAAIASDLQLSQNATKLLKSKLLRMVSVEGVGSTEYGAIIITPEISVLSKNLIQGGMRNITSMEIEMTLVVKNIITQTVYNTLTVAMTGEGYSAEEALCSCIRKLNASTPESVKFVQQAKQRIIDYYRTHTQTILTKANTLASQQQYDEALALLATYPESLAGYEQVARTMTVIFEKCQTRYCSQILLAAEAAYAQQDYEGAAELVAMIDAQSSCASQGKALLQKINKTKEKQYQEMLALEKEKIQSQERVRTALIGAVTSIATSFFQRQTKFNFL